MVAVERFKKHWASLALGLSLAMVATPSGADASGGEDVPLVAAIHVHSTASTGSLTLDELASRAEQLGIDALLLTENLALQYEYGVKPAQSIIKVRTSFHSLAQYGIDQYLKDVETVQARHPRVLLIPGVEVAPHYYWSGSLADKTLTMHNAQRNLLVFGLQKAEAYRQLPALGNYGSYHPATNWVAGVIPALLVLSALWVGVPRHQEEDAFGRSARVGVGKPILILLLMSAAAIIGMNNWPLGDPPFSPYDEGLGFRPYQALIDAATAQGGLVFWSLPEARDFRSPSFGPLGTITIKTDPHPEALLLTDHHHGFGGLYQEARTVQRPGGVWDQLVTLYQTGQRRRRPTMIGEIAFHSSDHAHKELDQVLTILTVRQRSVAGVLDALREGRAYAVERYRKEFRLALDAFRVGLAGAPSAAGPGSTMARQAGEPVAVQARVSATDQRSHHIMVHVIRSGEVIAKGEGDTPFEVDVTDRGLASGQSAAYRLEVTGGGVGELLTNPIYVSSEPVTRHSSLITHH